MDVSETVTQLPIQHAQETSSSKKSIKDDVTEHLHRLQEAIHTKKGKLITLGGAVGGIAFTNATPMIVNLIGDKFEFMNLGTQMTLAVFGGALLGLSHPIERIDLVKQRLQFFMDNRVHPEKMTVKPPPKYIPPHEADPHIIKKAGIGAAAVGALTIASDVVLGSQAGNFAGAVDDLLPILPIVGGGTAAAVGGIYNRIRGAISEISLFSKPQLEANLIEETNSQ